MRQSRAEVLALDSSYCMFSAWFWPISSHSEKAGHNLAMCTWTSVICISCPQSLKNTQGPHSLLKWHSKNVSKNSVLNRNISFSEWVTCLHWHVLLLNGKKDEECKWVTLIPYCIHCSGLWSIIIFLVKCILLCNRCYRPVTRGKNLTTFISERGNDTLSVLGFMEITSKGQKGCSLWYG